MAWRNSPKRGTRGTPLRRAGTVQVKARPPARPKPTPKAKAPTYSPPASPIPTATTAIPQTSTTFSGGAGGYDVNSDPAVAAAHGLAEKMRATARATALAKAKQAAIEYGDPTGILDPTTGAPLDAATAKASAENPFSVLKNLEHNYQTGTRDLEEGLNKANLFYSGYRGQQLGEAARGYQNTRYQAGTSFKGLMTDIGDQLANALLNADMYEQQALLGSSGGGYDGGGYDTGSGGSYWSNVLGPLYGSGPSALKTVTQYGGSGSSILNALGYKPPAPGPLRYGTPTRKR